MKFILLPFPILVVIGLIVGHFSATYPMLLLACSLVGIIAILYGLVTPREKLAAAAVINAFVMVVLAWVGFCIEHLPKNLK